MYAFLCINANQWLLSSVKTVCPDVFWTLKILQSTAWQMYASKTSTTTKYHIYFRSSTSNLHLIINILSGIPKYFPYVLGACYLSFETVNLRKLIFTSVASAININCSLVILHLASLYYLSDALQLLKELMCLCWYQWHIKATLIFERLFLSPCLLCWVTDTINLNGLISFQAGYWKSWFYLLLI